MSKISHILGFLTFLVINLALAQEEVCPQGYNYWPHPDCTKYYVCIRNGGDHVLETCPSALYWNQDAITCDWRWNVPICQDGTRPPISTTTPMPTTTTSSTTTTTPPPTTTPPTTTAQTEAPTTTTIPSSSTIAQSTTTEQPIDGICPPGANFWPHENCTLFYVCFVGGRYDILECPGGLYYNDFLEQCDTPANVGVCVGGTRPTNPATGSTAPVSTTTTQSSTTTELPTTTTEPSTTTTVAPTTTPPVDEMCPPEGTHKIPHEELCEAFWLCLDGVREPDYFLCPNGLYFDPILLKCNLPSAVECASFP